MWKRNRIVLAGLFIVALGVLTWTLLQPTDPVFRGKRESVWLSEIVYRGDDAQTQRWRDFDAEGIHMLTKGLNQGNGPLERCYFQVWVWLPTIFRSTLPPPKDNMVGARMNAAFLLDQLGSNAAPAIPALIRSLKIERQSRVRAIVIWYFGNNLPQATEKEKMELLPYLLHGLENRNEESERNNSAIVLGFYRAQADAVVPALTRALHDSAPRVCLMAVQSLNQIDPKSAAKAGAVQVVMAQLKNKDQQIVMIAARLLGDMGLEPKLAVPALIEASKRNDDYNVSASALWGLGGFKSESATIVPVLTNALHHPDGRMRYAASHVLSQMDPQAAAKAGVK